MPQSPRSLTLSVTPLVAQLISHSTQGQGLLLQRDKRFGFNPYATYLLALLDREMKHYDVKTPLSHAKLTTTIEVQIPAWLVRDGQRTTLTPAKEWEFCEYVQAHFRQQLVEKMQLLTMMGVPTYKAASQILSNYGIGEDHYSLIVAVRHFERHAVARPFQPGTRMGQAA